MTSKLDTHVGVERIVCTQGNYAYGILRNMPASSKPMDVWNSMSAKNSLFLITSRDQCSFIQETICLADPECCLTNLKNVLYILKRYVT